MMSRPELTAPRHSFKEQPHTLTWSKVLQITSLGNSLCIHRSVLTCNNLKILAKLCQICFSPHPRMKDVRHERRHEIQRTPACEMNAVLNARSVSPPADNSSSTGNRIWIWGYLFVMFCVGSAPGQAFVQEALLNVYKLEPATRKTGTPRFQWSTPPHRQIDSPTDILRYITQTNIETDRQSRNREIYR